MAYDTKGIVTDINKKPVPQYYNPKSDNYEVIEGSYGANRFIERGRIIKDVVSGDSSIVKNYSSMMYGLSLVNDSTSLANDGLDDITVTVNGMGIVIKRGEAFDDLFEPFTMLTIDAINTPYRLVVRE